MSLSLADHLALIEDEYAAAAAAPLSARKAFLAAVLLDSFADRAFAAWRRDPPRVFGAEDVLAFRAQLAAASPALARIAGLAAARPGGPHLVTRAVEVPLADYPKLAVEDFMVSLYNGHTVQRVLIVDADGTVALAHAVLAEAIAWWRAAGV